jgi:hypothetical protein
MNETAKVKSQIDQFIRPHAILSQAIALDHGPAICSIALDHSPALCGIALDYGTAHRRITRDHAYSRLHTNSAHKKSSDMG